MKKSFDLGFRGWMLVIYQFIAFMMYTAINNYPLNILADMYGGATLISRIYTIATILGIVVQLCISGWVGRMKSVKLFGSVLGLVSLILLLGIMLLPSGVLWLAAYGLGVGVAIMYATFALSILVGQWFPTRKGTVMGIATIAFPIANGLLGPFATRVFSKGYPDVFGAYLPFFIIFVIGWVIGLIFIKDFPEQCGAYRDNDKNMTPEKAQAMMAEDIENKKTTVWKLGATLKCPDFWCITLPLGALLMFSVGMMTQTSAIIGQFEGQLDFVGGYTGIMLLICIFGCIGSFILGLLDTRFGTKTAVAIAVCIMIIAGVLGIIPNAISLLLSMICLALFMGASSNFTVSTAAQYWRREDFSSVYAVINPVANIVCALGPTVIAMLLYSSLGYQSIFVVTLIIGIISLILTLLFKPSRVKTRDDKYRTAAGKPLDDALVGRK
ncbi:MAG: MFS transporter [Clostridiales bacterium]|nr:MFS transporter [Clostridiales bacterium]